MTDEVLIRAVLDNNVQYVKTHLNKSNVNSVDDKGMPLVFLAANGRPSILEICLGLDINVSVHHDNMTPFHFACFHGSFECMSLLLEHHELPDVSDDGYSPYHYLFFGMESRGEYDTRHPHIMKCYEFLVQNGCDLNSDGSDDVVRPPILDFAISRGWKEFSMRLISDGCDLDLLSYTPPWLHVFLDGKQRCYDAVASWLLIFKYMKKRKRGLDYSRCVIGEDLIYCIAKEIQETHTSPLWAEKCFRHNCFKSSPHSIEWVPYFDVERDEEEILTAEEEQVIDLLFQEDQETSNDFFNSENANNYLGRQTALRFAAAQDLDFAIVKLLIEKGADASMGDLQYLDTPLHLACFYGAFESVRLLLSVYKDGVHRRDWQGETPLHYLMHNLENTFDTPNRIRCFHLLVENGAEIDAYSTWGFTPLSHAIREGHRELASLLLYRGAKIENVRISHSLNRYPAWAKQLVFERMSCEDATCAWLLVVNRRFRHPGRICTDPGCIGYDLGVLIAKEVWSTRLSTSWTKDF